MAEKQKLKWPDFVAELRRSTPDQLQDELVKLKREAFNLRFQQATSQLEKTHLIQLTRKKIARVKAVMAEKDRAEAAAGEGAS